MTTDHRVYVMLGFHTSFHHSWRGDSPDEAGFGTDIRVVRQILQMLREANEHGWQARAYWDFDVCWTLQEIIPAHAPDILTGIRQRVEAGHDEVVLGPYNNGANHAATERELRTAIRYAFENPYGSGLRQLFREVAPILRPQECMYTAGQNAILLEEGVAGLILYYSAVPFNNLSTFVPALPPEQRYNPFWLRTRPDEPPVVAWPCISPGDLVDEVCLEALLLKLRRLQTSGTVRSDLVVHLNFDADAETWLPVRIPRLFSWFPNTGGLQEYIHVVNRYDWAEFTVPTEYARNHRPRGELLVGQDLADGGFDGNYSWAEKYSSLLNWTALEQTRLHSYRTDALLRRLDEPGAQTIRQLVWEGADSAFFRRLLGLSTTHFGMSTPVINEERQAKAEALLHGARQTTLDAERDAARMIRERARAVSSGNRGRLRDAGGPDPLYVMEVFTSLPDWARGASARRTALARLPVVLPQGVQALRVESSSGEPVAASFVDVVTLPDGCMAGDLLFLGNWSAGHSETYRAFAAPAGPARPSSPGHLQNRWLDLQLSDVSGVDSLTFQGHLIGGADFLDPFVTYRGKGRPQRWGANGYAARELPGEQWDSLSRVRLETEITMPALDGPATSHLQYTFTLFDELPYLLLDVEVTYARTTPRDVVHTPQQKLRRLLDLGWIEVAPCQLNPAITAPGASPLRVWKHNYLGVVSSYKLDYREVNPRNRDLDSFNHQVTAGWVAVGDGEWGLLLAEGAEKLASMAFCPMRLCERDGVQHLALNPFGSYFGQQPDYRHLGGNGLGRAFTSAASGALRPNGPSFNGQHMAFSLLLAPYQGEKPPAHLQAAALGHFYPPSAIYHRTPLAQDVIVAEDAREKINAGRETLLSERLADAPLPAPDALLASPADQAVDLVWEPARDPRLTGHIVRWRQAGQSGWQSEQVHPVGRWRVSGLQNGEKYQFQIRSVADSRSSGWSQTADAVPGAMQPASIFSFVPAGSVGALAKMVVYSLFHAMRVGLGRVGRERR